MITTMRRAVASTRFHAELYTSGERAWSRLPSDLGHVWRYRRTTALSLLDDVAPLLSQIAALAEWRIRDLWICSGRDWEQRLGIPLDERTYTSASGLHLSTEVCTCEHGDGDDDATADV